MPQIASSGQRRADHHWANGATSRACPTSSPEGTGLRLFHVLARELSLEQATEALPATPVPYGSWLAEVVVHVRGGHFRVPSSGVP